MTNDPPALTMRSLMGGFHACRITDGGLSHLFAPLHVGGRCACARKIAVVGARGVLDIQDGPPLLPHGESASRSLSGSPIVGRILTVR
jgi:hypothetical protein